MHRLDIGIPDSVIDTVVALVLEDRALDGRIRRVAGEVAQEIASARADRVAQDTAAARPHTPGTLRVSVEVPADLVNTVYELAPAHQEGVGATLRKLLYAGLAMQRTHHYDSVTDTYTPKIHPSHG